MLLRRGRSHLVDAESHGELRAENLDLCGDVSVKECDGLAQNVITGSVERIFVRLAR